MLGAVLDHLWQSTLFLAGAGLFTLLLRNNSAHVRFWVWFAASLKFLVPFSALTALARTLLLPVAPQLSAPSLFLMQPAAQPFSAPSPILPIQAAAETNLTEPNLSILLLLMWGLGSAAISVWWLVRWFHVRGLLHGAVDLPMQAPVAIKVAASSIEPGLVGIWRPVILLPQGICEHLSGAELNAVVAHEVCHFRRGDNLLAAVHMLVEALFWFYPPVWWLGARLNAERERACDESVLASGNPPQVYAESILKVCRVYLQSPLSCISGISSARLKKRMETIVENKLASRLNGLKTALLGTSAALAIVVPLAVGCVASPMALEQAAAQSAYPQEGGQQPPVETMPLRALSLDPTVVDRLVGYYELTPTYVIEVHRDGFHFFVRERNGKDLELFPASSTVFFARRPAAQISFDVDPQGRATQLILNEGGPEYPAKRIDEASARALERALAQRIAAKTPFPGTEQAVRHQIESLARGAVDYSVMSDGFAMLQRQGRVTVTAAKIQEWGAMQSITFRDVRHDGMDIYDVVFERQDTEWRIYPPGPDGKSMGFSVSTLP
jgi:beta-lactamase regulating signal transducer with metallopeptidase domain